MKAPCKDQIVKKKKNPFFFFHSDFSFFNILTGSSLEIRNFITLNCLNVFSQQRGEKEALNILCKKMT